VAKESRPEKLRTLRGAFASPASGEPAFTQTAITGGWREDEGLENLLPGLPTAGAIDTLKDALVRFLDEGGQPTVREEAGDRAMQLDAATFYEFRIVADGVRLYVKVLLESDEEPPEVKVISVKRWDR